MEKEDARKLSPETQGQLRQQAIRLNKKGKEYVENAEVVGIHRNTVSNWCKAYEREGYKGLKSKQRGFEQGQWSTVEASRELEIQGLIMAKMPDRFKLVFVVRTRPAIRKLIKIRFGINRPIHTLGEYLNRWGFTPQKPVNRAYPQRPAEVQKWLEREGSLHVL